MIIRGEEELYFGQNIEKHFHTSVPPPHPNVVPSSPKYLLIDNAELERSQNRQHSGAAHSVC